MIFSKLVVQSCRIKIIRPRLCCAQLRNSNSSSNFPNHGIDLDIYHTLASTNKVMADSFLLKQIEMKDVAMKSELRWKDVNSELRWKDEAIKGKDEAIKGKDEVIKGKDEVIKGKDEAISSNKLLIDKLNEEIIKKDLELCQTKGLMNIRGMFELLLKICVSEQPANARLKTVSQQIDHIMSLKNNQSNGKHTKELLAATAECGSNLHAFYGSLSRSIHGQPWHDHSIRLFVNHLTDADRMLAERIVALLDLKIVPETSD